MPEENTKEIPPRSFRFPPDVLQKAEEVARHLADEQGGKPNVTTAFCWTMIQQHKKIFGKSRKKA